MPEEEESRIIVKVAAERPNSGSVDVLATTVDSLCAARGVFFCIVDTLQSRCQYK
jgi:hypothetical protein